MDGIVMITDLISNNVTLRYVYVTQYSTVSYIVILKWVSVVCFGGKCFLHFLVLCVMETRKRFFYGQWKANLIETKMFSLRAENVFQNATPHSHT